MNACCDACSASAFAICSCVTNLIACVSCRELVAQLQQQLAQVLQEKQRVEADRDDMSRQQGLHKGVIAKVRKVLYLLLLYCSARLRHRDCARAVTCKAHGHAILELRIVNCGVHDITLVTVVAMMACATSLQQELKAPPTCT